MMLRMTSDVQPTGRGNRRLRQTARDMLLSLAVVLVVIAIPIVLLTRTSLDPVTEVEYQPQYEAAASQAGFSLLIPDPMPDGWRVTSARWEITNDSSPDPVWFIGIVTDRGEYLQIVQSATQRPEFIGRSIGDALPTGSVDISGTAWQRYEQRDPINRVLVNVTNGVTTIVSGTESWERLQQQASLLGQS